MRLTISTSFVIYTISTYYSIKWKAYKNNLVNTNHELVDTLIFLLLAIQFLFHFWKKEKKQDRDTQREKKKMLLHIF